MGNETKRTELERGETDPLHGPRKPSTADEIDEEVPPTAQLPEGEPVTTDEPPDRPRHR